MRLLSWSHFLKRCVVCPSESRGHSDVSFYLHSAVRHVDVRERRKPEHNVYNQSIKVPWFNLLISQVDSYDNAECVFFRAKTRKRMWPFERHPLQSLFWFHFLSNTFGNFYLNTQMRAVAVFAQRHTTFCCSPNTAGYLRVCYKI